MGTPVDKKPIEKVEHTRMYFAVEGQEDAIAIIRTNAVEVFKALGGSLQPHPVKTAKTTKTAKTK